MKSVFHIVIFFLLSCAIVLFCVSAFRPGRESPENGENTIKLDNLADGMTIDYSLLLVSGSVSGNARHVRLKHGRDERDIEVVHGRFKATVLLKQGGNPISLNAQGHESKKITVKFQPRQSDYAVRMIYIVASDGDGTFQAPAGEANDIESAKKRLALGGLILQSATAELMNRAGFGRQTFQLICDSQGSVQVEVFRTSLTVEQARTMGEQELWHYFNRELKEAFPSDNDKVKNVAVMSMTQYDSDTKEISAHTALGKGSFALYGSGGLHSWAESCEEIADCFSDMRKVANYGLFDDSSFRKTFWANYSTGLGASLHELAHTFGLEHTDDPQGIMKRGFDRMNRIFMLTENGIPFGDEKIRWTQISAKQLSASPWFQ